MDNKKNTKKTVTKNDSVDLKYIVSLCVKNWKWFALSLFISSLVGALYFLIKNPVYYVDSYILLKEEDSKSKSGAMSMLAGLGDLGSMMGSKNVDNEVGVLNTRMLMKQTILDLNLHIESRTRKGLKSVDMYPGFPFNVTVNPQQVDTIECGIKFKIKPVGKNQYHVEGKCVRGTFRSDKFETTISQFPAVIKTSSIDINIDRNQAVELEEDQIVKVTISNPNVVTESYREILGIGATSKKTSIIRFGMETDNVKKAQDLMTTMIGKFNIEAVKDKNEEAYNTSKFVEERLYFIASELKNVEDEVAKYKQDNNLTDISSEAKLFLEQMGKTETKRFEVQTQLNVVDYLENFVKDEKNKNKIIPGVGLEDKSLLSVIVKYNELLMEKNTLESSSSENNPSLIVLNNQLLTMRQNILSNIKNVKESLNVAINDIKGQDKIMNSRIKSIPQQERNFIEIARQRAIKEELYVYLLKKREEVNLSLASTSPKAKTIDEPMPGIKPIAPKKINILLVIMFLGFGMPFVIIYLLQMLNTKVSSKEELERLSDVEVIGEIALSKSKEHVVVKKDSVSPDVELFRLLRANILFKIRGTDKKVFLITSTIAGEGKTFIGTNLALSMALTGKKILLAGLDIRKPRLAEYLGMSKVKGITDYLSEDAYTPVELIQKSNIHPNLDILQAGTVPPNPNELLMEEKLDKLFEYYRTKYDYIIIDTAPVGIVSDTFLLDRLADVVLYVNRINYVHKDSIKNINTVNANESLKNMYVVANGIQLSDKNGGYGYGYGHK